MGDSISKWICQLINITSISKQYILSLSTVPEYKGRKQLTSNYGFIANHIHTNNDKSSLILSHTLYQTYTPTPIPVVVRVAR